jgi:hypothetical protein
MMGFVLLLFRVIAPIVQVHECFCLNSREANWVRTSHRPRSKSVGEEARRTVDGYKPEES